MTMWFMRLSAMPGMSIAAIARLRAAPQAQASAAMTASATSAIVRSRRHAHREAWPQPSIDDAVLAEMQLGELPVGIR